METEKSFFIRICFFFFSGVLIVNSFHFKKSTASTQENMDIPKVISYRSASCSCCKEWVNHLRGNGLEVVDNIVEDISEIKKQFYVPNNLRSCHSAKIDNYSIEGHVPIESIKKLFQKKPIISGIAVPGMPHGSPGMDTHSHESNLHTYESYKVISYSKNGKTKIFDYISP